MPTALSEAPHFPQAMFAAEVAAGLSQTGQKTLPSKYFYDTVGSALFEAITALPEYTITRAEERLLRTHAAALAASCPVHWVAELGSGDGRKTHWLLERLGHQSRTTYFPIEISPTALELCQRALTGLPGLSVRPLLDDYLTGLRRVTVARGDDAPLLVLFLGSSLGNFDHHGGINFLRQVRRTLRPGDYLLLGTDLLKKQPALIAAYADPLGVTAAFNLNILARINRELEADFVLPNFRHVARWNAHTSNVEMHLLSICEQCVRVPAAKLQLSLAVDETILTEISHKYLLPEIATLADSSGFACTRQWVDAEALFVDSLFTAI